MPVPSRNKKRHLIEAPCHRPPEIFPRVVEQPGHKTFPGYREDIAPTLIETLGILAMTINGHSLRHRVTKIDHDLDAIFPDVHGISHFVILCTIDWGIR